MTLAEALLDTEDTFVSLWLFLFDDCGDEVSTSVPDDRDEFDDDDDVDGESSRSLFVTGAFEDVEGSCSSRVALVSDVPLEIGILLEDDVETVCVSSDSGH